MPRMPRLTDALRGRGKALAYLGAAAALAGAGAGTAAAATTSPAARPEALSPAAHAAALTGHAAPAALSGGSSTSTGGNITIPATAAPAHTQAPATHTSAPQAASTQAPATQQASSQQPSSQQATEQTGGQLGGSSSGYEFYDSVTPSQIPAGHQIATYADGPYAAQPSQVAGKQTLWIDTNGSDPSRASVLDVEPGDATPTQAAQWVQQRETAHPGQIAVVYTMRSEWGAAQQAISALPHNMQANVRWWIADPTGTPHVVPGATATQWYWGSNYDISSANGSL